MIVPILWMRKLRLRENTSLICHHMAELPLKARFTEI